MRIEFILVLIGYITIGSTIATFSRKFYIKTLSDYYVGSGRLSGVIAAGTYAATTYSAFMMVGLVGLSYATGVGALGFEILYLIVTVFLLTTIGYETWRLSKKYLWISPSQMIGDLYGSKLISKVIAVVYLFAMIPYLTAQIQGLRVLFSYGGLDGNIAIIVSAALTYAWIVVAGVWSVALTDLYQGIVSMIGGISYLAWLLLCYVPMNGVQYSEIINVLSEHRYLGLTEFWRFHVYLAYTIPWIFFAITNPQVVSRLYMPRDENAYKKMVTYFSLYGFAYTIIAVTIGLFAAGLSFTGKFPIGIKRDDVTPYLLNQMSPILGSIVATSIIAAAVSTANSIVLAVSSSVVKDLFRSEKPTFARLIDGVLVLLAALIAIHNIGFVVELSVLTSVLLLPIAPVTILGIYKHGTLGSNTKRTCVLSLIIGVSIGFICSIMLGPREAFTRPIIVLPLSLWILVTSTIILLIGYAIDRLSRSKSSLLIDPAKV